ncbi:MAG: CoA-binding protein [Pleurocapsa sp.]
MNWLSPDSAIVQGINEGYAAYHAIQMKAYGTKIVAGISPGNKGKSVGDIPLFDLVEQAIAELGTIETSLIFEKSDRVLDAAREAIAAEIKQIIIFTSGVPPLDTIEILKYAKANNTLVLGPGSHGIIIPEQNWLGTLQPQFYTPGEVGLIGYGKYLSYEVAWELNRAEIGQSIVVSLGNDRIIGSGLSQWLSILNEDPKTKAIIVVGQHINETKEITDYCRNRGYDKPILVYLAGLLAPQEQVFQDATTIISNYLSFSIPVVNQDKQNIRQLIDVGIQVAKRPNEIPIMVKQALNEQLSINNE